MLPTKSKRIVIDVLAILIHLAVPVRPTISRHTDQLRDVT